MAVINWDNPKLAAKVISVSLASIGYFLRGIEANVSFPPSNLNIWTKLLPSDTIVINQNTGITKGCPKYSLLALIGKMVSKIDDMILICHNLVFVLFSQADTWMIWESGRLKRTYLDLPVQEGSRVFL